MMIEEGIRWAMALGWLIVYFLFYRKRKGDFSTEETETGRKNVFFKQKTAFYGQRLSFLGEGMENLILFSSPGLYRKKIQWMEILKGQGEGSKWVKKEDQKCGRDLFLLSAFIPLFLFWSPFAWITLIGIGLRYYASISFLKSQAIQEKRKVENEITNLLTGLVLSLRAGMLLDAAWKEIAQDKEGPLYEEMRRVSRLRKEGVGFNQAYLSFGERYQLDPLKDFNQLVIQNVELGGSELARGLDQLRRKESKEKINRLHKAADRAQEQMLLPGLLQFIGILLLLLVPLFKQNLFNF